MKRLAMCAMTLMLVAGAASPSLAQGPPPGPPPLDRIAAALQLTDEQKAAWTAAHQNFRATAEPLFAQARALHDEIESLIDQGNPDPAVVGQKTIALHAVHQQIKSAHDALDAAVNAMLTPEQKTKLEALKAMRPGPHDGPPRF